MVRSIIRSPKSPRLTKSYTRVPCEHTSWHTARNACECLVSGRLDLPEHRLGLLQQLGLPPLQVAVEPVLDSIVRPAVQHRVPSNLRPPIAVDLAQSHDCSVFFWRPWPGPNVRIEVMVPPLATLLCSAAFNLGCDVPPIPRASLPYQSPEQSVFISRPRASRRSSSVSTSSPSRWWLIVSVSIRRVVVAGRLLIQPRRRARCLRDAARATGSSLARHAPSAAQLQRHAARRRGFRADASKLLLLLPSCVAHRG